MIFILISKQSINPHILKVEVHGSLINYKTFKRWEGLCSGNTKSKRAWGMKRLQNITTLIGTMLIFSQLQQY